MIDQIGGWTTAGVGQGYGDGYLLEAKAKFVSEICRHYLESGTNAP